MKRSRRRRRRKCLHCQTLYIPDPRTQQRQKHCSAPECKRASKAWRQRRWLSKPQNRDYFRGPHHVSRTQAWRRAHPGYWRRGPKAGNALQDGCASQVSADHSDKDGFSSIALQDDFLMQPSLVVGLIAQLTGSALQDDIATSIRHMHARGQIILGMGPGIEREGNSHDRQTPLVPR